MNGSYRTKPIREEICANEGFHDSDVFRKGQFIWQRCNQRSGSADIIAFFGALNSIAKPLEVIKIRWRMSRQENAHESMVIGRWTTYCVQ